MNVLKIYNDTYWSLINLNDNIYRVNKKKRRVDVVPGFFSTPEEKERVSLSRTKRRIKDICLCNDFEYFVTMTVSSKFDYYNRFDLEECVSNCKKFMHKLKRKSKDFKFIFIIEEHKKGGYHFHGFMKSLPENDIYTNENGYLSSHILDGLGFNSFDKIQDYNKCCNYITKYITKKCCKTENNQIYFCSRGLKKPKEEFMINQDLTEIFEYVFQNDYCQKKDFDISRLSEKQKLKLNKYFNENDDFFANENNSITNWLQLFTRFNNYDNIKIHK